MLLLPYNGCAIPKDTLALLIKNDSRKYQIKDESTSGRSTAGPGKTLRNYLFQELISLTAFEKECLI